MKKHVTRNIITLLLIFLIILEIPMTVFGVSFNLKAESSKNSVKEGEQITVKLYLQDYEGISSGLNAYKATLEYDENVFEKIKIDNFKSEKLWEEFIFNENTNEFIAIKKAGSKSEEKILEINLKAKKDVVPGETTIKVKDIVASEGYEDINTNNVEFKIDVVTKEDNINNSNGNNLNNNTNNTVDNSDKNIYDNKVPGKLPNTGKGSITSFIMVAILALIIIAIIFKYKENAIIKKMNKNTKLFATILCFGIVSAQLITNIYAAVNKGELSDDGKIDYADVNLLERHLIHLKELEDNKKNVADINNDAKLTITDLSLLVRKIENTLDYTVNITSNLDSHYAKKNDVIDFKFIADVSYDAKIESVLIDGIEYFVQRENENSSEYTVKISVPDKPGIQEIKITEVILEVGKRVKVKYSEKIEILKDIPLIENYTLEENIEEGKLIAKFNIKDVDAAITTATAKIYDENDVEIQSEKLSSGENTIEVKADNDKTYKLLICISYNQDSNALGQYDEDKSGSVDEEEIIEYIKDYNLTFDANLLNSKGEKKDVFEKDEVIVLDFISTNVSTAFPRSIKINGKVYEVIGENGKYSARILENFSAGNMALNIEELKLSNGKILTLNKKFDITIIKKAPIIENAELKEDVDTNKLNLNFNVKDEDNTITSLKYVITNENDKKIAEKVITNISDVKEEIELLNDISKTYTVKVIANYTTNTEVKDKILYTNSIDAIDKAIIENGEISKEYFEKNEEITIKYTINTNKDKAITKMVINNIETNVKKSNGKYIATIPVGNNSGKQDIKVTKVIFEDEIELNAMYTNNIEILKDKPTIENIKVTYDYYKISASFEFELKDNDNAIKDAKIQLAKKEGTVSQEQKINVNKNSFELPLEEKIEYDFEILVTYSRYSNGENVKENEVILNEHIQLIKEYDLKILNIKTFADKKETKYFNRNDKITLQFESTNDSVYNIKRVKINGKEYNVQFKNKVYSVVIDGFDSNGIKDIKIEKVWLENFKELDVNENNVAQIEILKVKPTVEKFEYKQVDTQTMELSFEIIDLEETIVNKKITVLDEKGKEIETTGTLNVGKNTITLKLNESEEYTIKIIVDYDLDTNKLSQGYNEYKNQEIFNKKITIQQELIEFKDIESVKLFKEENNTIVEETVVNVQNFEKEKYIVEVTMKKLPKFYAEIKDAKVEDGNFMLVLNYGNVVQYENNMKTNELKVKFAEVNNNIASNMNFIELIRKIKENPTGEFTLTKDLDANDLNLTEEAVINVDFKGKLNGNGFTIKNLKKVLFKSLNGATVSNLILENANISDDSKSILANSLEGAIIQNVHIINSTMNVNQNGIGAIAGKATNTTIKQCSSVNVNISGKDTIGGIVGSMASNSAVENCYVTGKLSGTTANTRVGGICGWAEGKKIENVYTNVQISGSGNDGGIIGGSKTGEDPVVENAISIGSGTGYRLSGFDKISKMKNVYEYKNSSSTSHIKDNVKNIVEIENIYDKNFYKNTLKFDEKIWNLDSVGENILPCLKSEIAKISSIAENTDLYIPDLDRLSSLSEYDSERKIVYSNMYKLIPFYDAKYIVYYGNKIEKDNVLNQSKIKMIVPYDSSNKMIVGLNTNNYNKIAKIKIIFENEQTVDYDMVFDKKINDVAVYNISKLNIKYNYNKYILNTNISTLQNIIKKAKELDYANNISIANESRLYRDYYNETVTKKLDKVILEILENIPKYNLYLDNPILKKKIEDEIITDDLKNILYTYNYFDKWYHFEVGGIPLTNIIFTNVNDFNEDYDILTLVQKTMAQSVDTRKTNKTVTFFNNVIKGEMGDKGLGMFLEYFIKVLENGTNANDWFKNNFKGIICEAPATGDVENKIRYRAWDTLKLGNNYGMQYMILPILSAPQKDMYIISAPSQFVMGSLNVYSQYVNSGRNHSSIKWLVEDTARRFSNFYGVSASFITDSANILNGKVLIEYDSHWNLPGGGTPSYVGTQNEGTTEEPIFKWVYDAIGGAYTGWHNGGVTNGSSIWYAGTPLLGIFGTVSHETAHCQDSYYFYERGARRDGTGPEDHADGNISQYVEDGSFTFNLSHDEPVTSDISNNLKAERLMGEENVESYYREMFETLYVLDYLVGQAFLQLSPEDQAEVGVQTAYETGQGLEVGAVKTQYFKRDASFYKNAKLSDMEDLWNNGIALHIPKMMTSVSAAEYGEDYHYSTYWYQPHNNNGRPESWTFKRLGFEMLGIGGYDAYVIYRSTRSENDLDALRKITGDSNITWKKYKLDRYKNVEANLNKIPYFDYNEVIAAYKEALEKDAERIRTSGFQAQQPQNSYFNYSAIRRLLFGTVKRATKDFTTGTIYSMNEPVEISTAQQFVDVIKSEEWGNYKLTKDLDFTNISLTNNVYVDKTFVGRIDGNGKTIKGLQAPIFKNAKYAEIQNIKIDCDKLLNTAKSIFSVQGSQLVFDDVVVNNVKVQIPLVQNGSGLIQWLGDTAINVKVYSINNIEDFKKIENNLSGKYELNTDIDLSEIGYQNSILGNFSGVIDGKNHKLYNLNAPIFAKLTGEVKNLKIENVVISKDSTSNIAPLAKESNNAKVYNVKVKNTDLRGWDNTSSLIGKATNTTFERIEITGSKIWGNQYYKGTIVGRSYGCTYKDIIAVGKLDIKDTHNGGLVGAFKDGNTLTNIYVDVKINRRTPGDRNQIGGLYGAVESGNISVNNVVVLGDTHSDLYKVVPQEENNRIKNNFNNVYELKESNGKSNVEGDKIKEVTKDELKTKDFYTEKLKFQQDIWDFSNIGNDNGIPTLK